MTGSSGTVGILFPYDGLEFDRRQTLQLGLSAASMIGAFDPRHDRYPELVTGGLGLAV